MADIIDITKKLKGLKAPWTTHAIEVLNTMDQEDANAILAFILTYVMKEVEAGLGLIDSDDDDDLQIFGKIDERYQKAAAGCYFCDKGVDPNETGFTKDTGVCMMCQLKLRKLLEFNPYGVPK